MSQGDGHGHNSPLPNVGSDFAEAASDHGEKAAQPVETHDANNTAAAEIESRRSHDAALDVHDQRWREERNRLANGASHAPSPPGMSGGSRDIREEYFSRRYGWEQSRDGINASFETERNSIREAGTTLSGAFSDAAGGNGREGLPETFAKADGHDRGNDKGGGRGM